MTTIDPGPDMADRGTATADLDPSMADPRAVADLLRISEPGDRLLRAAVATSGAEPLRGLLDGPRTGLADALHAAARAVGLAVRSEDIDRAIDRWTLRLPDLDGARDLRIMRTLGARVIQPGDPDWPAGLRDLGLDEPAGLWVRGHGDLTALTAGSIALVGSRAADSYGLHLARSFAWDLVAAGHSVVSGGAYGIDAAAHAGALAAADRPGVGTIAFMAGGVDRFYPRGNADLLTAVARTGVVISEAAPGSTAMRHRFLMRNRLIAATAAATVVVQAGWRSGALNTANRAAELLRPVGAVPGPVTAHDSAGCHRLIREGAAVCVTTADEVRELVESLTELSAEAAGPSAGDQQGRLRITDDLTDEQARIYSALPPRRGTEVAALASRAGLEVPAAMGALAVLELAGLAERRDHGWVKLRRG